MLRPILPAQQSAMKQDGVVTKSRAREHVHRSLLFRLRLFALIFVIMLAIVVADTVRAGWSAALPALAALGAGLLIGVVVSRVLAMSWDEQARQVVGRIDALGAIVLLAYVVFTVFRSRVLGSWLHGDVLGAVSVALLAGLFAGQLFGTAGRIARVFRALLARGDS